MKILIIGSKGFIGSHLTAYFKNQGHQLITCDVINDAETSDYFIVEKINTDYSQIFKNHLPDVCVFAGGNGSVPFSLKNPAEDFHLNTVNVHNILDCIRFYSPGSKFIHFSSAAVYGNPRKLPISESDPVHPLSPYGWHKYLSEQLCLEFHALYGIPTISMRVFSVYGERLNKQLFWDIYQKMKMKKEIELFGTGSESRDFIYIDDLLIAVTALLQKASFKGEVYNVATGIETSIKTAAELFCHSYDPEVKVQFNHQTKPGDPVNWRADISKLNEAGFKQSVHLPEGLRRYITWLKENESH